MEKDNPDCKGGLVSVVNTIRLLSMSFVHLPWRDKFKIKALQMALNEQVRYDNNKACPSSLVYSKFLPIEKIADIFEKVSEGLMTITRKQLVDVLSVKDDFDGDFVVFLLVILIPILQEIKSITVLCQLPTFTNQVVLTRNHV